MLKVLLGVWDGWEVMCRMMNDQDLMEHIWLSCVWCMGIWVSCILFFWSRKVMTTNSAVL